MLSVGPFCHLCQERLSKQALPRGVRRAHALLLSFLSVRLKRDKRAAVKHMSAHEDMVTKFALNFYVKVNSKICT